jgi:hypothetical protein
MNRFGPSETPSKRPTNQKFGWEHEKNEKESEPPSKLGRDRLDPQWVERNGKEDENHHRNAKGPRRPPKCIPNRCTIQHRSQLAFVNHMDLKERQFLKNPPHADRTEEPDQPEKPLRI